jgi:Family of unknown function (DUF5677)
MPTVHKAFLKQLETIPRLILLEFLKEKLETEGIRDQIGLLEALTDHCLSGGGDIFEWDNGAVSGDISDDFTVSFTEKDTARLAELSGKFFECLPTIIEDTSKFGAKRLLKTLKRNWPDQTAYESSIKNDFKGRLEVRWGEGFDLLRMLLTSCLELGEESSKRLQRSKAKKNRVLRSLLVRMHARACQITAEILTLMENGFADGAMARWRTLYEVGVVATVIADAGEVLAESYIQHEVVESKLAMDEYRRCYLALGYKPMSGRECKRTEKAFAEAVAARGADFGKPYGWAAAHLKKKKVTFRDLEDAAQRSPMRSYYKMASYNVHADTPKSLFFRLGVIGDQSIIVAGATDAGFTEPAQNAAITLVQITSFLIADRVSNVDMMINLRALLLIRDEIPNCFMRAERKLRQDHKRLTAQKALGHTRLTPTSPQSKP